MNIILFLTDQERAIQHFPPNWLRQNLPGMRRLRRHGLSFERAFTNACMCSPARSTLMSGYFPAQHGVKYTLEEDMPAAEVPAGRTAGRTEEPGHGDEGGRLQRRLQGQVALLEAGRRRKTPVPSDLEKYGFPRWNPPDAGANQSVPEAGGGFVDNDGRFIDSAGDTGGGTEGALQYLSSTAAQQQPFFMVISLVNPHDVLFYPSKTFEEAGYDDSWLRGRHRRAGDQRRRPLDQALGPGRIPAASSTSPASRRTKQQKRNYLNFYGNLMRSSDNYLVNVLDKLEETGLFDDTLIVRTADHGEMGLTHGGLRQKNFNFYEEATRVPLVYSNPKLFPKPAETDALVSHVDFLPTLASLAAAPKSARANWQGVDYSKLVLHPQTAKPVQDYVVFTYDDFQSGQAQPALPETAEPHRQHPRRALEAGQVLRRQRHTKRAAVGDVRPEDRPAGEDEPRLQRLRTHARRRRSSSSASNASWPGSKRPACSRCSDPLAPARFRRFSPP